MNLPGARSIARVDYIKRLSPDTELRIGNIADPTHADAIRDRFIHSAHKLALQGPSRRKPEEPESDK